jgi:WD40 repeat protein
MVTKYAGKSAECIVWTADSMGVIHEWRLDASNDRLVHSRTIEGHETSVTDLLPVEDGLWSGRWCSATDNQRLLIDIASMDKSAQLHRFESLKTLSISHDSSVHSLLLLPAYITPRSILLTGSDDEDVRVWETEDDWVTYTMISRVVAHSGPVTSMICSTSKGGDHKVVTGSLDGTLRSWTLAGKLFPGD